jgi:hypothetical protein
MAKRDIEILLAGAEHFPYKEGWACGLDRCPALLPQRQRSRRSEVQEHAEHATERPSRRVPPST